MEPQLSFSHNKQKASAASSFYFADKIKGRSSETSNDDATAADSTPVHCLRGMGDENLKQTMFRPEAASDVSRKSF